MADLESAKDVSFGRVKLSLRGVGEAPWAQALAGARAKKKETENRYAKDFFDHNYF